jgi:hypothetical protein
VAGRIRSIEKSSDLIENEACDLPAGSIVLQPTMLLHASGQDKSSDKETALLSLFFEGGDGGIDSTITEVTTGLLYQPQMIVHGD